MAQFNPSAEDVMKIIGNMSKGNFDLVKSAGEVPIAVTDAGELQVYHEAPKAPGKLAASAELQLLARIDVPGQFFHRCKPELKRHIMTDFYKNRNFMWRCRGDDPRDYIRAVLGPRYPTDRDDIHLFPIILNALQDPHVTLASFEKADHVTELIAFFTDTRTQWNGGTITGSISITNSETGHSSLWIEPQIQIWNGIWLGNRFGDKVAARYVHRGELPTAEDLKADIDRAKQIVQIGIIQYLEASEQLVSTGEAIKYLNNLAVLPKRFGAIIAEELADQERIYKVELIRRILLATQELPLIQSLQIRREVGGYVGLFENTASRMSKFAQEIE